MALRSTLSLLIQIPFFIAAYHFLSSLESLKGASFLFINDLGSPDALLSFNVLPVIMTVINLISGYIYAKDYDLKEKLQLFGMSAIFLILLYNSPSALVLYWTFNNIFSLIKNIIHRYKNPGKIFYGLIVFFLVCACIYVLFFRSQGRSGSLLFKTLTIGTALLISAIPFLIKFLNYLGKKYFYSLKDYNQNINFIFIASAISLWILCALIIPLNVISSDTPAFSFLGSNPNPFSLVFPAACISLGLFVFWPCYIFFIFPNKTKVIFAFLSCLLLLFGICNTFIFFGNNGILSENLTFVFGTAFNYSFSFVLLNILVFILILSGLILVYKKTLFNLLSSLLIILLITGSSITLWKSIVIQREYRQYATIKQENEEHTIQYNTIQEKLQTVINLSKTGKNVIVIMLDRAIGSYLPLIFEEKPELASEYSGFVYYPNTVSFFRSTILGTPPIFGGYEYTPEELHKRENLSMVQKHDESLLLMPSIFKEEFYDVSVFDLPYVNYSEPMNRSFFIEKGISADILTDAFYNRFIEEFPENKPQNFVNYDVLLKRNFLFFSITTITPPPVRNAIYKNGSYWSSISTNNDDIISNKVISEYSYLYYLPQLCSYNNENNTLTLMVSNLTHTPSFLQYPDYTIVPRITDFGPNLFNGNTTSQKHYHINSASYLLLAKWFDELKRNGVYDNTRIIIVSDHDHLLVKPLFSDALNRINTFYHPVLLVKDFEAQGILKTDMTFMTTADVPLIATTGIIKNPKNPYTGNELKYNKDNGANIYLGGSAYMRDYPDWKALEKTSQFYHVKDNIFDTNNWTRITKRY